MHPATGDIDSIEQAVSTVVAACERAAADSPEANPETDPAVLSAALNSLLDVMHRVEADRGSSATADVTEIGEYAIRLMENLAASAQKLGLNEQKNLINRLFLDTGLWIAQQGGMIDTLEPVVDAVAMLANSTRETHELAALADVIRRLIAAVPAVISQDLETINPGRPWRVLLLNYCIVATRSHNPALMETAFELLTSRLPADAPRFFTEGMQQMDALNYPGHVRQVMEKYHRKWSRDRSLH